MTTPHSLQTIDHAARPDGHPGYCACPECFEWYRQREARGDATPRRARVAANAPASGQPSNADLYALVKNTRSWVMVIAWIVVIQATLAVGFGAIAGYEAFRATRSGYSRCLNSGGLPSMCEVYR